MFPTYSQTATGRISGTVKDQTGGAIVGAAVVVTDVARGLTRNLVTDEAGAYLAPNLISGTYTVRATFTGFQAWERTNIVLPISGDIAVDAVLTPGAQTQTVTITEELPLVNTTSSTIGGTFTTDTITELPVLNRNYLNIMDLRPAVVLTLGNDSGGGGSARTNGLRPDASNNYMIEGLMGLEIYTGQNIINRLENNGDVASIVPNDSIQEFNQEFNSKAEYGNKAGSSVNVGLKSGTNAIHGTGYGYFRNAALDSRNYFNPEPDRQVPFRQEQIGATLGGPIVRDKLFFFLGYEQQNLRHRNLNSLDAPFTDPALIANFPACISTSSCAGVPNAIAGQGTVDSGNHFILGCLAVSAGSRSAQSLSMLGLNPDCTPGANFVNPNFFVPHGATDHGADNPGNPRITTYYPNSETTNLVLGSLAKLDYQFNEKHSFNGFYFRGWGDRLHGANAVRDGYRGHYTHSPQMVAGTWTWLPSSSLANSFRVGYTHLVRFLRSADQETGITAAELGIPTGVTDPVNAGTPRQIALNGFYNLGGQSSEFQGPASTVEVNDALSYLRGQHALRFGGTFLTERIFQGNLQNGKGIFGFGSSRSNSIRAFIAGQNAAAGLTSGLQSAALLYGSPLVVARRNDYAFFIQDDWRIHPRLTLNLGVRYDYATTIRDDDSFFGRFDPDAGMVQVGAQIPRLYNPDGNNWAPRVGFAWDIRGNGRTVLRGGGSIVFEMLSFRTYLEVGNDLGVGGVPTGWVIGCGGVLLGDGPDANLLPDIVPGSLTNCAAGTASTSGPGTLLTSGGNRSVGDIAYSVTNGTLGALQWDGPSTRTIFPPTGILNCSPSVWTVAPTGGDPRAGVPCPVASVNPKIRTPYVETWTLSLQHAIISNVVLEAAYVGNHGVKLFGKVDPNQPPPGSGWTPALIALCNANRSTASCADNGAAVSAAYTTAINAARPFNTKFPHISVITHMDSYQTSNYNGLQATLTARNFHGLSLVSGYTWSHALEISGANNSGLLTDSYIPSYDYGQAGGDLRHRFTLAPTYTFPNVQGYAGLLEGWKMSGAFRYQVGRVSNFTYNRSFQGTNRTTSRWDLFGDPKDFQFDPYNVDRPGFFAACPTTGSGASATANCTALPSGTNPRTGAAYVAADLAVNNSLCTSHAASIATLTAFGCWVDGNSALTPPALGTFGNSGRGMFTGISFWNLDMSVGKRQRLTERFSAEFRAELYNILNHPAFDDPGTGLQNADSFTVQETPDVGATNPFLGSGGPRRMQFGVKIIF